MAKEAI